MSTALRLKSVVDSTGTITQVSIGTHGVPGSVRLSPETAAGRAAVDAFDWSDAAQQAWEEDQRPARKSLRQAAANAVADNDAFLALGSPTNAQVLAQVRRMAQQLNRVIPRLIQLD